jgi:DNA-binding beta-propeller fold protein YncE
VAVDSSSNVYIADSDMMFGNAVHKYAPNGSDGYNQLSDVANIGLNRPFGVAVESGGNVYISNSGNGPLLKVDFVDARA